MNKMIEKIKNKKLSIFIYFTCSLNKLEIEIQKFNIFIIMITKILSKSCVTYMF